MRRWLTRGLWILVVASTAAGCTSASKDDSKANAIKVLQEMQQPPQPAVGANVLIVGSVRNSVIPYTSGLTLKNALIAAQYTGVADPREIAILRAGQRPIYMQPAQLLSQDFLLEPGDRVELRP